VDKPPFFIVGAGRSGTTLLRLILAGHSRLHIPPETWFIRDLVSELPLSGALTHDQIQRCVEIMTGNYRWPDMGIAADDLRRWVIDLENPALRDVINLVYLRHLQRSGKHRFGDKTPHYIHIVPQLAALYPGAKFIHLIRDGRDVAISQIDLGWDSYYERNKFDWSLAMESRRGYLKSPCANCILEIRYEDLIRNTSATIEQICAFLDEPFEPAMLEWHHLTALVPSRERHIHRRLEQPMSNEKVGGWQHRLSALECFAVESCLHRDLTQLGYQLRFSGAAWQPLLGATGAVLQAMAPWLRSGVRKLKKRHLLPQALCL
jgi:Sulfotransferase family